MSGFKKVFLFTPRGTVEPYCALQKPDYGNEEKGFGNPRGVWKVNLTVPSRDAQPLIDKIVECHEKNYAQILKDWKGGGEAAAKAKLGRGKTLLEPYEGQLPFFENDDGTVTFKLAGYASYLDKKTGENKAIDLRVVDSKGKRIDNVPAIAGGSEGKARFSLFPYGFSNVAGASVKLQLDSFMLLLLKEFQAGADDWADEQEDGFVAEDQGERDWSSHEQEDGPRGHAAEEIPDEDDPF